MTVEKSCGAVVFTRRGGVVNYVLIHQLGGVYGFPKGHVEGNETEEETALREIFEEVGLRPRLIPGFRATDEFPLPKKPGMSKQVVFFLAEYEDQKISVQRTELRSARLVPYEKALSLIPFDSSRRILRQAHEFLMKLDEKD